MSIEAFESKLVGGLPGEFASLSHEQRYGELRINYYKWYYLAVKHDIVNELDACLSTSTIPSDYIVVTDLFGLEEFLNKANKGFTLIPWKYFVICSWTPLRQ